MVPNLRALAKNSSSKHLEESQYEEINCLIKVFDNSVQILRILNQIIHQGHLESFRKICNNRELFQEIKSSENDFFADGYKKINSLRLFVWNDHDFDFYIRGNSVMSKNFDKYDTIRDMCEKIEKHFENQFLKISNSEEGNFLNFIGGSQCEKLEKFVSSRGALYNNPDLKNKLEFHKYQSIFTYLFGGNTLRSRESTDARLQMIESCYYPTRLVSNKYI